MLRLAVIGKDVSKSLSPEIHKFILPLLGQSCSYEARSMTGEEFERGAETLFCAYDGFNVTIPYKQSILPYLKRTEGDANAFGAVNTVVTKTRTGYNTDGAGFLLMIEGAGVSVKGKRVLVLGAGGAGRSCIFSLAASGAEVFAYERDASRLEGALSDLKCFSPFSPSEECFDVIVNCTGVGMHDSEGCLPTVADDRRMLTALLRRCETAVDLIYVPRESEFLRVARSYGKRTLNGEAMLFYQAYCSDCHYTARQADAETAKSLWKKFKEKGI